MEQFKLNATRIQFADDTDVVINPTELTSEKERFELLASSTLDGLLLCDSERKVLFINNSAKRILGFPVDKSFVGESLENLNVQCFTDSLNAAQENNIHEVNKVADLSENHTKLIGFHLEFARNSRNEQIGWLFVLRDVTQNWQNEQMRSALTVASHEIKTPLNSMLSAVDLLLDLDLGGLNPKQNHCLRVVKDDIQRLNRLLVDLLDLSRFDEGIQFLERRRQTSLVFLVNKVLDSFRTFAKSKNIQLENKIPKSIPTFKGDRDRLQQVLSNLVENGIKYSMPGGSLSVDAELQDTIIKCRVNDTGVGIPSSDLQVIFEKFKQLDNFPSSSSRGYGLGLSIAKQIIEANGGKIWVESELHVGSTFFFTIPV
ncbi:MAG: PAS domain-containing protein [Caldithrix sp.]|nr:MAG: PAS domain-containing protein [Caldithrix sp.]